MGERFGIFCCELAASVIVWGFIEIIDSAFDSWELPGWVSLLIALVIVFGGWFIIID